MTQLTSVKTAVVLQEWYIGVNCKDYTNYNPKTSSL